MNQAHETWVRARRRAVLSGARHDIGGAVPAGSAWGNSAAIGDRELGLTGWLHVGRIPSSTWASDPYQEGIPRGYALNAETNPRSRLESTKARKNEPKTNLNEPENSPEGIAQDP